MSLGHPKLPIGNDSFDPDWNANFFRHRDLHGHLSLPGLQADGELEEPRLLLHHHLPGLGLLQQISEVCVD